MYGARRFPSSGGAPHPLMIMAEQLTEEQKAARIAALRIERLGYVKRGLDDRVAQVDAEIQRVSGSVPPASQARAVRRPRVDPERETR